MQNFLHNLTNGFGAKHAFDKYSIFKVFQKKLEKMMGKTQVGEMRFVAHLYILKSHFVYNIYSNKLHTDFWENF